VLSLTHSKGRHIEDELVKWFTLLR
jgi:hypothetical protein